MGESTDKQLDWVKWRRADPQFRRSRIHGDYRIFKSLFVPPLYAQTKTWKNSVVKTMLKVDEVFQMGNLINLDTTKNAWAEVRRRNDFILKAAGVYKYTDPCYTNILGTNELLALNSIERGWMTDIGKKLLIDAWHSSTPMFKVADSSKGRLVTHSGLTHGLWNDIGRPQTAKEAAAILNEIYSKKLDFGSGIRLGGALNLAANPVFADPVRETMFSWLTWDGTMPFGQIFVAPNLNKTKDNFFLRGEDYNIDTRLRRMAMLPWGSMIVYDSGFFLAIAPTADTQFNHFKMKETAGFAMYAESTRIPLSKEEMLAAMDEGNAQYDTWAEIVRPAEEAANQERVEQN